MLRTETFRILETLGLADQADVRAGHLSHGDLKRLEIGIALGMEPELLLLDEPTAGMSPEETAAQAALMERLVAEQGLNILFTEHDMDVVFGIAKWITVLHQGRVIADGKPVDVRRDRHVQAVYLGEEL
jgi:branched-chain amino acid transport system ATP-binding protein